MENKVILLQSDRIGDESGGLGTTVLETFLTVLEEAGVKVLACKTCVDHYGVEDQLVCGKISGMSAFVELAAKHPVITIG